MPEYNNQLALAAGGYRTYGMGVAMLYNPEETVHMHGKLIEDEAQDIAENAKTFMYMGLYNVIRFSHPELAESRHVGQTFLNRLKYDFKEMLPFMMRTVDRALSDDRYTEKMDIYCSDFTEVRPAPMCVEGIYSNICSSRPDQVSVGSLMSVIPIDERFPDDIASQPVQPFVQTQAPNDLTDLSKSEMRLLEDLWLWGGKQDPRSN